MMRRQGRQRLAFGMVSGVAWAVTVPILLVVGLIAVRGLQGLSWSFVTEMPREGMTAGGILPALIGTVWLTLGTAVVAMPLAIGAAVYLAEYARPGPLTATIRLAIVNLAGIPSIVYGLFGLGLFVLFLGLGTSIAAGALTLGLMTLPVVISTAEEAIRAVPQEFRVTSLSLGASRWQTIRHQVLPHALPGILTGVILGLSRAAGETAPILFTAAAYYLPSLPTSPGDPTMALPYHLYVIATQVPNMPLAPQFATALILMLIVLSMTVVASVVRSVFRRRREW
jgi:phosphate transport system permease protein